jgi:hypothetical protein
MPSVPLINARIDQVFERWWKLRMGINEADTPVIPEFFQYKMEEFNQP